MTDWLYDEMHTKLHNMKINNDTENTTSSKNAIAHSQYKAAPTKE